jgi:O-antigen/teichoic acid export membrane protein
LVKGLKWNLAANIIGAGWSGAVQLACVPIIVKLIGVEAYGLIGFYVMLLASLQFLDMGLGPTINRELAKYSVAQAPPEEVNDFVRTLEFTYWAIGLVAGLFLAVSAPFIAKHWITTDSIPVKELTEIVLMMAFLAAIQWPATFYRGGLMGLQRQVLVNTIRIANATLSNVGALLILLVSPNLYAYFIYQIVISACNVIALGTSLWFALPSANRKPYFSRQLLIRIRHFAAGMGGITFFGIVLTQIDKLVLSNLLDLRQFGFYTLAGLVASSLQLVISPIFSAVFPRMSELVAMRQDLAVAQLYHDSSQLMAALVIPISLVLVVFPRELLLFWTHNADVANNAFLVAALLVIGTAINGLMNIPYALHLAYGWTSIGVKLSLAKIVIFVPVAIYLVMRVGAVGAAATWAGLNLAYFAVAPSIIHKRLHLGSTWKWVSSDLVPSLLLSSAVVLAGKFAIGTDTQSNISIRRIAEIAIVYVVAQLAAACSVRWIRTTLRSLILRFRHFP